MRNFSRRIFQVVSLWLSFFLVLSCNFSDQTLPENPEKSIFPKNDSVNRAISATISADTLAEAATKAWKTGDYQLALDKISKAYQKAEKSEDKKSLAKVLNTFGLIQWRLGNNAGAMDSYEEAAKIAKKEKMFRLLGLTFTNRGLIFKDQENLEAALSHNQKAIELFKKHNNYRELAIAQNNQGQIFKNKKRYTIAKKFYLQALENYEKAEYANGAAATYHNLSQIYMWQHHKEIALEAAKKSLVLGLESKSDVRITEAYLRISETHEYFNQSDSALKYFKIYNHYNEALVVSEQTKTLAISQAKLGSEVKSLQIENLKKEQELAQNKIRFVGIVILILLLAATFFVYRYLLKVRFNKQNLEMELRNSEKIIEVKERELRAYILDLTKKNSIIKKLQNHYKPPTSNETQKDADLSHLLQQKILTEEDWENFKTKFRAIYPGFFQRMKQFDISLTEAEIRLIVLLRLNLSGKEMAKILGISPQSVRVCKMRLKKKLQQEGFGAVEDFLQVLVN